MARPGTALPTQYRKCKIHGSQIHRPKHDPKGVLCGWVCARCKAEYDKERRARIKEGTHTPQKQNHNAVAEKLKFCDNHPGIALPASGICDDC